MSSTASSTDSTARTGRSMTSPPWTAGAGRRLLVVDDQPGVRLALGRGLARYGYKVSLADGGAEALKLLAHLRVDAVVTDVVLGPMTGLELAAEIIRRHPRLPILFVTDAPAPAGVRDNPFIGVVAKSASPARLRDRLDELIAVGESGVPRDRSAAART